jgi:molybdate transport system ATP-binding protein
MLEVDVRHSQGAFTLDAAFVTGEGLTALVGPSGSGKTTLINIIAGLTRPVAGHVRFDGADWFDSNRNIFIPANRRRIGYVFQDGRLFPHLNVRQNLEYARRFDKQPVDLKADAQLIDLLGIRHLLDRRPAGLSGGEKSRVAIGRALYSRPQLLIMDEPLSALDAARKAEILPHLEYIRDETGIPVFYVSHAMEEVARLATGVISISAGKLTGQGDPAEVLSGHGTLPPSVPPGTFLQAMVRENLPQEGLAIAASRAGLLYLRQSDARVGDMVRVHVPASDIMLATEKPVAISALNCLAGQIEDISEQGNDAWVVANCSGERVLGQITRRSLQAMNLTVGQEVYLLFKSVSISRLGLFHRHE